MRIIRMLLALMIVSVILSPKAILAASAKESNETNIKKDIDKLVIENGIIKKNEIAISFADIEEEKMRKEKLARFQSQLEKAKFPEGKFVINASAYTAAADECGKSDGITASGLMVKERETIACPAQFPFGTKLNIQGLGTYVCQDRGGAIKGNHIDIYVETKKEAFAFGRQNLLAEVVN